MKGTRDTKATPPVTGTPDRAASQAGPMIVYLAALAAVAGIPVHLYWALGGTWGYPGGAATAGLPGLRAVNLVVSALLACGAVYLYGLTRPWARRPPALLVLAPVWAAAVICVSHGLFGIATKGLYLAGLKSAVSWPEHALTAGQKNLAALHDLTIFEPWFLILGLLLALAGRWFAGPAVSRRRWTLSLAAAIVLIDAFGVALALTHHRFAVALPTG
ncbi:MAG: DUF3995 domain-containing protein [Streptosporangiaceae bacterium]